MFKRFLPTAPTARRRQSVRRKVLAASTAAGLLVGLASCASDDSTLSWDALTSERPFLSYPDLTVGFDRTSIEQSPDNGVDTKNLNIRVDTVGLSTHLSPEALRTATYPDWDSEYEIPEEGVDAPDGFVFYASVLVSDVSYWNIADIGHPNDAIFRVVMPDGQGESYTIARPALDTTILFLAPEDAAPEDYVLSVDTEGVVQELSLIDGSRVHSDIEHLYTANNIALPTSQADIYVESEDAFGNIDSLWANVNFTYLHPWSAKFGRPDDGNLFLAVHLYCFQEFMPPEGGSTTLSDLPFGSDTAFTVTLPDGEEIEAFAVESTADFGRYEIWFEIPSTQSAAEFVADIEPFPRRADLDEAFGDLTLTESISFSRSQEVR